MSDIRNAVKEAYGKVASSRSSCCGPASAADSSTSCCGSSPVAAEPASEFHADLGLSCGDPVSFSQIKPGDVVLDLGSGAGKDVFVAAGITGEKGRVMGVDMTPEMIELARKNAAVFQRETGLSNFEFREGFIEDLPVESGSVDVVISNCVINLSPDKEKVFREAFRALNSGGRLVVSDIVLNRELPDYIKNDIRAYAACISGALKREDYLSAIRAAGFSGVEILADKTYSASGACDDPITSGVSGELVGAASSITVLAVKQS